MKKMFFPVVVSLFAAGAIFTSCESPAKKVEDAQENLVVAQNNLEKAKMDSISAHERAKADYLVRLQDNEKQMADYKLKIAKESKTDRERDEQRLNQLQVRNEQMKTTVNNYEAVTLDGWEIFKAEFNRQREEFNKGMTELEKSLSGK